MESKRQWPAFIVYSFIRRRELRWGSDLGCLLFTLATYSTSELYCKYVGYYTVGAESHLAFSSLRGSNADEDLKAVISS